MMKDQPTSVSVVIPVFNERDAVRALLERMIDLGQHEQYDILVVDDGSSDGSGDVIREFPVRCVTHRVNQGYGAALKTGIRHAKGQYVVTLDSDGQHDPCHIHEIVKRLADADMVIAERDAASRQQKTRLCGKQIIRWVGEYLVEQPLPDFNSGYRGFRKERVAELLHIFPNGFSFSTTSTLAFIKEGYVIDTFEIHVATREGRPSSVRFFRDGGKTLMLMLRIIMLFNPLKLFLPASAACLAAGGGLAGYGYGVYARVPNSATILMTLGFLLFFVGLLADQISLLTRRR